MDPRTADDARFLTAVHEWTDWEGLGAEQLRRLGDRACEVLDGGGSLLDATDQTMLGFSGAFALVNAAANIPCPEHADASTTN